MVIDDFLDCHAGTFLSEGLCEVATSNLKNGKHFCLFNCLCNRYFKLRLNVVNFYNINCKYLIRLVDDFLVLSLFIVSYISVGMFVNRPFKQ